MESTAYSLYECEIFFINGPKIMFILFFYYIFKAVAKDRMGSMDQPYTSFVDPKSTGLLKDQMHSGKLISSRKLIWARVAE